jgi:nicotinamide-nucleotide amidase
LRHEGPEHAGDDVLDAARSRAWMIATAESCTGGMVATALTDIPGSSDVFERGFVAYAYPAKIELLGVSPETLSRFGAGLGGDGRGHGRRSAPGLAADLAVSVTGIAGPGGGTADKPVGLVCFATAVRGGPAMASQRRFGDIGRAAVREDGRGARTAAPARARAWGLIRPRPLVRRAGAPAPRSPSRSCP